MLHLIKSYFRYLWQAKTAHSLHSPFVFHLYTEIITAYKKYYVFNSIEKLRIKMLSNYQKIDVTDFGAGSHLNSSPQKTISSLAKISSTPAKEAQLLFKLINYFDTKTIVELGTCLGLTTLYLQKANSKNKVYTFEGCPNIAKIAKENFKELDSKNIDITIGNIDETLPKKLIEIDKIDFLFLDANHRYQATLNYFDLCLPKLNKNSIVILDDIHWSADMEKAWNKIIEKQEVTISIDLFGLGILFFHQNQEKQNFILRF
ncbi:MAG: class I SAM-dependent methyltransferase [Bacteroidetes bacterium]|nr:MAG: class I SAM-dependent methyltransferase [Bacteroidota bacterium]